VRDFAISQRNRELLNPKLVASLKASTRVLMRPIGLDILHAPLVLWLP
jgi:hypothetical protein